MRDRLLTIAALVVALVIVGSAFAFALLRSRGG